MAPPSRGKGPIKSHVPYYWDDVNKEFVAWDGGAATDFQAISEGLVPGKTTQFILATHPGTVIAETKETAWDQTGLYTYLTADTALFASSSDAGDTTQTIIITGLTFAGLEVVRTVALNGQTQVALDDDLFRVFSAISTNTLAGDVYIAETDTLTGGVPNTASKIKAKIIQGNGVTRQFTYTVPAGKSYHVYDQLFLTGKNQDIHSFLRLRLTGFPDFIISTENETYQTFNNAGIVVPFVLTEMTDFDIQITSSNTATRTNINFAGILTTNPT